LYHVIPTNATYLSQGINLRPPKSNTIFSTGDLLLDEKYFSHVY